MKTPLEKLLSYCISQTEKGNHFFYQYSGHVNTISIDGYDGPWMMHKHKIGGFTCDITELDDVKVDKWISLFDKRLAEVTDSSCAGDQPQKAS